MASGDRGRKRGTSYSPIDGQISAQLSYSLSLLIDYDIVEINHSGRLSAMGGVKSLVIVEGDQRPTTTLACEPVSQALRAPCGRTQKVQVRPLSGPT